MANINPHEIHKTWQDTLSVVDDLSVKTLAESEKVQELIQDGTIKRQKGDEGHLARLKLVLNQITLRFMKKAKNQALKERMQKRTDDLQSFIDDLLYEHNQLFSLIQKMSKSQKETGDSLADLSDRLSMSEQGVTYLKILDAIIHRFMEENKLNPEVETYERPNIYREYSFELNMLYQILLECHESRARRIHLCLGCWQFVSFGNSTLQKYKNVGFKGRNYPLLIKLADIVDSSRGEIVDEPKFYLNDVIYFLWHANHKFFRSEINEVFEAEVNTPDFKFMPFPNLNMQERTRKTRIAGIIT